jgi:hypothetical protein
MAIAASCTLSAASSYCWGSVAAFVLVKARWLCRTNCKSQRNLTWLSSSVYPQLTPLLCILYLILPLDQPVWSVWSSTRGVWWAQASTISTTNFSRHVLCAARNNREWLYIWPTRLTCVYLMRTAIAWTRSATDYGDWWIWSRRTQVKVVWRYEAIWFVRFSLIRPMSLFHIKFKLVYPSKHKWHKNEYQSGNRF